MSVQYKEVSPFSSGREVISSLGKINVGVEIRAWADLLVTD